MQTQVCWLFVCLKLLVYNGLQEFCKLHNNERRPTALVLDATINTLPFKNKLSLSMKVQTDVVYNSVMLVLKIIVHYNAYNDHNLLL